MNSRRVSRLLFALSLVIATSVACTEDDPAPTDTGSDTTDDASDVGGGDAVTDVQQDIVDDSGEDVEVPGPACEALATDYTVGGDAWPACVSDDGTYHRIEEQISSLGRIGSFEEIADLLWRRDGAPSSDDFIEARDIYATGEGLDSRVQRREDEHFPPVTDATTGETLRCRDEGVPELDPVRCVGPAQMVPILNDAFQRGITGDEPLLQAARIEATLLWFLYMSVHKEAVTCAVAAKDCDSAYAYYTGGADRSGGLGLASRVLALDPATHERVWDGLLALRCWRDLDPGDTASDLALQTRAVDQLDRALLKGVSELVIERLERLPSSTGAALEADTAFVRILGSALLREANDRDATLGAALEAALEADELPAAELQTTLRTLFPCP